MSKTKNDRSITITTPSFFGSHSSMIVENEKPTEDGWVTCKDDFGKYLTERKYIDTGLSDPHRISIKRAIF